MTISVVQNEPEHWHDHVAKFVSSGKTQKEYCLANDLDYSQFKKWRYKFSEDFPVNKDHPSAKRIKNRRQTLKRFQSRRHRQQLIILLQLK